MLSDLGKLVWLQFPRFKWEDILPKTKLAEVREVVESLLEMGCLLNVFSPCYSANIVSRQNKTRRCIGHAYLIEQRASGYLKVRRIRSALNNLK
jgi:hypothetical protein